MKLFIQNQIFLGRSYTTFVNSHLTNSNNKNLINDLSDLINIKNVNGDETFSQNENSLIWSANGSDIYYQGESSKDLPIECSVKYELDGKEISAKDLAGKAGKVKITIEYKNKDEHIVNINGKDEKLYTPFVVICGTILDNTIHRNITVSSVKVVDDGSKTFVLGMALPGFKESLSMDDIDVPSKVEITMDSSNFESGNIASFVTPKVFEESDLSIFDELDNVYSKVNTLRSSSSQLENGANTLKSATNTFYEKSQEFNGAMKQVSAGANTASENYSKINNGIDTLNKSSVTLSDGAKKVSDGTTAISNALVDVKSGVSDLKSGSDKLQSGIHTLVNSITPILKKLQGISDTQNSITSDIETDLTNLVTKTQQAIGVLQSTNNSLSTDNISKAFDNQIKVLEDSKTDLDPITDKIAIDAINKEIASANTKKANIEASIQASVEASKNANLSLQGSLGNSLKAYGNIAQELQNTDTLASIQKLSELSAKLPELVSGVDALANGTDSLQSGVNTLASKSEELSAGAKELYDGTKELSSGTKILHEGSNEMKSGLDTLSSGTSSLTDANNLLTDASADLSDGVSSLANGVSKFNREGINPICNYINGDLKDSSLRLEKLQELADDYDNFTMLDAEATGSVKFIMIMDGIKSNDNNKEEAILDSKNSK